MTIETEQQTEQTETQAPELSERDQLIRAVREAGGTESADIAREEQEAAARAAAAAEPAPAEAPKTEESPDRLTTILREREERHKEQEAQRSRARNIEQEARDRADQILRDAQAKAQKVIDDQIAEHRAKFASSPTAALRTLGLDSQQAIDAVLAEGTPQARALAEANQRAAKAEEIATKATSGVEEFQKWKKETEEAAQRASYDQYLQTFLTQHASEEKAPYLNARFEPEQISARAVALAQEWANGGLTYAKDGAKSQYEFDDSDVVAYLEKQSKERIAKLAPLTTPAANQVGAGAPATGPGNAPKVSASSPRTLSATQGSERRAAPKPLTEMTPAQQRQALIEDVAAARRANPDADW